jgi:hypothetical protein
MSVVFVYDRQGRRHAFEAEEGSRLMEIISDWGVPIGCECGGAASCVKGRARGRLMRPFTAVLRGSVNAGVIFHRRAGEIFPQS